MIKSNLRSTLFCMLFISGLSAQDARLSQPWSMQTLMNPALSGNIEGIVNAGIGSSWQKSNIAKVAHQFAYADVRILRRTDSLVRTKDDTLNIKDQRHENNYVGLGASYYGYGTDLTGNYSAGPVFGRFYGLHGSYNFNLSRDRKHSMGLGAQLVFASGNVNESRGAYDKEINGGGFRYAELKTNGTYLREGIGYADINLGGYYRYTTDGLKLEVGLGTFHVGKPRYSLKDPSSEAALRVRLTYHTKADIRVSKSHVMTFRSVYWTEGMYINERKIDSLNIIANWSGAEFRNTNPSSKISLSGGIYSRNFRTIIPTVGLHINRIIAIKASYEQPLNRNVFPAYSAKRFELGVQFLHF